MIVEAEQIKVEENKETNKNCIEISRTTGWTLNSNITWGQTQEQSRKIRKFDDCWGERIKIEENKKII